MVRWRERWSVMALTMATLMMWSSPAWAANDARSGMIFGVAVLIEILTCLGQVVLSISRISQDTEGSRQAHRMFSIANTIMGGALVLYMLGIERVGSNMGRLAVVLFFGAGVFVFGVSGLRSSRKT